MQFRPSRFAGLARFAAPLRVLGVAVVLLVAVDSAFVYASRRGADVTPAPTSLCASYDGLPEGFGVDPYAGMVAIEGGTFERGSMHGYADERPARQDAVASFHIDRTEVTNAQFLAFVRATGYQTSAEREGGAAVFHVPTEDELARDDVAIWRFTAGADFRHPEGPGSSIEGRANRPVTQVSWDDARAYAAWLRRALPTEAEWEYAARAGRTDASLHRAPRDDHGRPLANFWQGEFPVANSRVDGHLFHAPVGCFPPNAFGLFDTVGNVWEWTADAYSATPIETDTNGEPTDCRVEGSGDGSRGALATRVIKGGSFLCASNFCARYRVAARHPQEVSMSAMHVGFRTVKRD